MATLMTTRYQQRRRERLLNPEILAGYQEMDSEIQLVDALNRLRDAAHISVDDLAQRMGRKRTAVSRLLNAARPNPTLETLTDMLSALGITAEIHLRPSESGEAPIRVVKTEVRS